MCYDDTARPPLPPISGAAGIGETRHHALDAADGNRFAAYSATTAAPGGPGIVILPDVRGLYPFYEELADRFAEAGVHATALDYFGRTAGVSERGDDFDWEAHVWEVRPEHIAADTAAAAAYVRSTEGGAADAVFTVGFCFGGRASFNQAAERHGLAGVIGFYGFLLPREEGDPTSPIDMAARYEAPVLGLFGGADQRILADHVASFERALDDAGVDNEIVTYEGAPHSFFDRTAAEHAGASDDAWRRMLAFIAAHRTAA
jgi:carboxymethylenebutenolidase